MVFGLGTWLAGIGAAILNIAPSYRQGQLLSRLQLATETAGISIWEKDLLTGELVNDESLWRLFGLSPSPTLNPRDLVHESDRTAAEVAIRELLPNRNMCKLTCGSTATRAVRLPD